MSCARPKHPFLATLLAACVLLLGCAAHSAQLHDWICGADSAAVDQLVHLRQTRAPSSKHRGHGQEHGHDHDHGHDQASTLADDHACAVTLFAAGTDASAPFTPGPPTELRPERVAAFSVLLICRMQRGPQRICGPPEHPASLVAVVHTA